MALGDPQIDPEMEAQLYGEPYPSLLDTQPFGPEFGAPQFPPPGHPAPPEAYEIDPGLIPASGPPPFAGAALPAPPPPPDVLPFGPQPEPPPPTTLGEQLDALDLPPPPPLEAPPIEVPALAPPGVGLLPPEAPPTAAQPTAFGPQLPPAELHYQQTARDYQAHPEQLLADLIEGRVNPETQRYLNDLQARDPVAAADIGFQLEDAKHRAIAAKAHQIATEDYDRQRENLRMRDEAMKVAQAKTAQLEADAQRLANTKIDPTGGLNAFQKIAGVFAAVVGGLYQGASGSARNPGLDQLNHVIERNIEAQKANILNQREGVAMRRSALGQEYARIGDMYQAQEIVRLAALKYADGELATMQQNYAADGTRGIQLARLRAGVQSQMVQARQAYEQKNFENHIKLQSEARQQQATDETARHQRAEEAIAWTREAREGRATKADNTIWSPEQLGVINAGLPKPPIAMTQAEYTKWLGTQKEGEQYKTAARANDPNERARELAVSGIVDDRGQPVLFADSNIKAVRDGKESTEEMVRLTDDLVRMIKANGWSSEFIKSKEWRNAVANYNEILIKKKEQDKLGVLTGPDVGIVTKEIGTTDPTEARSQQVIDALLHFRHNQIEGFNTKARTQAALPEGRTIKRWEPPLNVEPAPKSPEFALVERLKTRPDASRDEIRAQATLAWTTAHPEFPRNPQGQIAWTDDARQSYGAAIQAADVERHDVTPQQRADLASLVAIGKSGDEAKRTRVLELLAGVAKDAHSKRIRALAEDAANEIRAPAPVEPGPAYEPPRIPSLPPPQPTFPGGR